MAVVVTVLWHGALVGWWSTLGPRVRDERTGAADADAIDIVFVPRRITAIPPADSAYSIVTRREPAAARIMQAPTPTPTPNELQPTLESLPEATADRIDVVTGDDRWSPSTAATEPRVVIPPRNPLARVDRHALDMAPRMRVRMRPPRSLATWLKAIAPAGYEADPCPEIARAITGLASDAAPESRALLDHAVDFEARYCR